MNKKSVKLILFLLISLIFFMPNKTNAVSDYTIKKYNIDMVVNEDNTFDITENITAYFNIPKHGIYRKIPLRNKVQRADGSSSNNKAKITDIIVSENYTSSKSGGFQTLQIGSSSSTLTGEHTYTIKYKYDIGKDPIKDADELYFNLIGDEWDTSLENVDFKITMPKEFDSSKLGFSTGKAGTVGTSSVLYNVSGKTITGHVTKTLRANEGLTVRCALPEGYFVGASSNFDIYSIAVTIFSIGCVIAAYMWWKKYGKDDEVVETVEFYPPKGYNSAEVGFMYKGSSDDQGVISLLIYLADKGYLKIEETEEKGLLTTSKGFKIIKVKDYDGNNEIERIFFNGLFDNSVINHKMKESKEQGEENIFVTSSELYDKFYMTIDEIKYKLNSSKNKDKIFESTARGKIKWLVLMALAIFALISIKPLVEYQSTGAFIIELIFPVVGFIAFTSMIFNSNSEVLLNGKKVTSYIMKILMGIIFFIPFTIIPWCMFILPAIAGIHGYILMNIVGIISIIVITVFIKIMPKRTDLGNEMLGKLSGFKRFLETAEKERLERLVEDDPEYFYNILPYTYALGVSEKWMKQFETMAMEAPDWYVYSGPFIIHDFNRFMVSTMSSAQSVMTSSPQASSSGGGFSSGGGGFSGGGSGGGRRRLLVNSINAYVFLQMLFRIFILLLDKLKKLIFLK